MKKNSKTASKNILYRIDAVGSLQKDNRLFVKVVFLVHQNPIPNEKDFNKFMLTIETFWSRPEIYDYLFKKNVNKKFLNNKIRGRGYCYRDFTQKYNKNL